MSENVLHLENVTMQFGGVVAVSDATMDVNQGEIVALIGPNGAGKTTAFNVHHRRVRAHQRPREPARQGDRGGSSARENEKALRRGPRGGVRRIRVSHTPDKITKMGMARTFQNIRLFKSMTVFENVLIAKHMHTKAGFFTTALHLNGREEKRDAGADRGAA